MNSEQLEKYSSAITLSDMEIFVFPELMYSLVLANIMSPVVWRWRQEDCFKKLEGKTSYRKLMRLKQYIMDEVEFNLDLETWGLTHKDVELGRFAEFIDPEHIGRSNALFGYHGDKYYFDVDIRRHFGLDKYNSDIIPYWKTETAEAMDAFRLKEGYSTAAGECVSLAALYAAAAFVVCGIPLEDIYMILTPLHSQNYLDVRDGVLTNNRRVVTKSMWFNGTAISNKAQRALRNEQVTMVAHSSGYVHCLYEDATIDADSYKRFVGMLRDYLTTSLDMLMFANFLRSNNRYQKYFQLCKDCHGHPRFMKAEVVFHYEHTSNFRMADRTHDKLLAEVQDEDMVPYELPNRIRCDQLEKFLENKKVDVRTEKGRANMHEFVRRVIPESENFVAELADFVHIDPRLPSMEKNYAGGAPIGISTEMSREQIIEYLRSIRQRNTTADLAFYAFRDMAGCDWEPFVKAAVQRNPVSLQESRSMSVDEVFQWLKGMRSESIYGPGRLAQPDEVVNYGTGDGLEKAFVLANVLASRTKEAVVIDVRNGQAVVKADKEYWFDTSKGLQKKVEIGSERAVATH